MRRRGRVLGVSQFTRMQRGVDGLIETGELADPGPPGTLYRVYNAEGRLLYVGASGRGRSRIREHMRSEYWWPDVDRIAFEEFSDREMAFAAETIAIRTERPVYNVQKVLARNLTDV